MTTRAQLAVSVDAWLARDDIAVTNADFVQILLMAESLIARRLRLVIQEVSTDLVFTGRTADLPANFIEPRTPFIDDTTRDKFEFVTPQLIRDNAHWNTRSGSFYTFEGSEDTGNAGDDRVKMVIAGPASASAPLTVTVNYFRRLPALTNDTDTNWLLINHFDVFLHATLAVACEYRRQYTLEDRYRAKFEKDVKELNRQENRKRFGGNAPKQQYGNPRGVV